MAEFVKRTPTTGDLAMNNMREINGSRDQLYHLINLMREADMFWVSANATAESNVEMGRWGMAHFMDDQFEQTHPMQPAWQDDGAERVKISQRVLGLLGMSRLLRALFPQDVYVGSAHGTATEGNVLPEWVPPPQGDTVQPIRYRLHIEPDLVADHFEGHVGARSKQWYLDPALGLYVEKDPSVVHARTEARLKELKVSPQGLIAPTLSSEPHPGLPSASTSRSI